MRQYMHRVRSSIYVIYFRTLLHTEDHNLDKCNHQLKFNHGNVSIYLATANLRLVILLSLLGARK